MRTRNGLPVVLETTKKQGMTIFVVFGTLDGKPCHWTAEGKFRMDGIDSEYDIIDFEPGKKGHNNEADTV